MENKPSDLVRRAARRSAGVLGRIQKQQPGRLHASNARSRRRVFVIADNMPPETLKPYLAPYRDDELHVMAPQPHDEWELAGHQRYLRLDKDADIPWHLKLLGPADVIMYARRGTSTHHAAMLRELLFHIAGGGEYVIALAQVDDYTPGRGLAACLDNMLTAVASGQPTGKSKIDKELTRATRSVTFDRSFIRIRKRGQHYLKLTDKWANRMLGSRNPNVKVRELARLKRGLLESPGEVESVGATRELNGLKRSVPYPAMHLREYRGHIGFISNCLTFTDNEILPDSFPLHLMNNLENLAAVNVDHDFARIPEHRRPRETLDGAYFLLDSPNSGHFGHLMTQVISRLWGWDRAKQENPELKALLRIRYPNERVPELERTVFNAFGIERDDIHWVDHPVYLETAYAATPMFHNVWRHETALYVHPQVRDVWRRIRDGLDRSGSPHFDRIFVSRRDTLGNRRCLNGAEVEQRFADAGFEIVYPEDYPLRHQAGMMEQARVIAGFGGSGMFNAMFAEKLEHMIVLNQEAYVARNEQLIALALGANIHYIWNVPEIQHPSRGFSKAAYRSNWAFDFKQHGETLDRMIDSVS